jgi:hypothetical protein
MVRSGSGTVKSALVISFFNRPVFGGGFSFFNKSLSDTITIGRAWSMKKVACFSRKKSFCLRIHGSCRFCSCFTKTNLGAIASNPVPRSLNQQELTTGYRCITESPRRLPPVNVPAIYMRDGGFQQCWRDAPDSETGFSDFGRVRTAGTALLK